MKTLKTFIILLFISVIGFAQNGINYKALIKDASGNIISNTTIQIQFTIVQGVIDVYTETHSPTTDANGIVIVNIGEGTPITGLFTDVDWASDNHFLNVQIDTGSGLVDLGTTPFMYVPYAKHAKTAKIAANVKGLEAIDEGNGIGWRLIGRNAAFYGDIGENAVDLSYSNSGLIPKGALGLNSFATGFFTTASGDYSTSMGYNTEAVGDYSTSLGFNTETLGNYAIASGRNSYASGEFATAMGENTTASGNASSAMGSGTTASGEYSTAIGINTTASEYYSAAMGRSTTASGTSSTAMGSNTEASGDASTAIGTYTTASGIASTAMGSLTTASGLQSIAMGSGTIASGGRSTAMGTSTIASGDRSTAMGINTESSGIRSTAMGNSTTASEFDSTAMGGYTEASGGASTAMGFQTVASGDRSTAMGYGTIASADSSTAMGSFTEASGTSSTAMGSSTTASGNRSTAMGSSTEASGDYSTTMGVSTKSEALRSTAIGSYNIGGGTPGIWINTDPLFEIGNGISDASRSNAVTVLKNGNVGIGTATPQERLHISGGRLRIGTETIEDTGINRLSFNADLLPDGDNAFRLGNASDRWTSVWATDGTINTSDRRSKTNIINLEYGLKEVLKLKPVSFNWKTNPNEDTKLGLIAQDLLTIIPEVVKTHDWVTDKNGHQVKKKLDRMGVYYSDIIPVLINAIQEQQKIIESQENALKLSKNNFEALLSRIEILENNPPINR